MAEVKQEQKVRVQSIAEKEREIEIDCMRGGCLTEELIQVPYHRGNLYNSYEAFTLAVTESIPRLLKRKGAKPYYFSIVQDLEGSGDVAFFESYAENEEAFRNSILRINLLRGPYAMFQKHPKVNYIEVKAIY